MSDSAKERALWEERASSLTKVVDGLAADARRIREGAPLAWTQTTLHLSNGQTATGTILDVNDGCVLLRSATARDDDLTYVPMNVLVAVTVHDFRRRGSVRSDIPAPPTKLELRRQLAKLSERHPGLTYQVAELSPTQQLGVVLKLAETLTDLLLALRAEPAGAEALQSLQVLELGQQDEALVTREGATLRVYQSLKDPITAASLRQRVEQLL